jgi:hypothetical protein
MSTYYDPAEISTTAFPNMALSGDTPMYLVEFTCAEGGCGLAARVYKRDTRVLPEHVAVHHAKAAIGGINAMCPAGHFLSKADTKIVFCPIVESLTKQ